MIFCMFSQNIHLIEDMPSAFCIFFIQVYVDALTNEDMQFIGDSIFPNIDNLIISKMVQFSNRVSRRCLTSLVFFLLFF